jgi:hypothetical protein
MGATVILASPHMNVLGRFVVAIALGLLTATRLTGVGIPVSGVRPLLSVCMDAAFSALTTVGYIFLFNVRTRLWWACAICGLCSHTLRTLLMHLDWISPAEHCSDQWPQEFWP